MLKPAHNVIVTSATLRGAEDWAVAEARTGAAHVPGGAAQFSADSPFDYAANSEVLIVTDLKRGDVAQLAGAYARLIEAAEGGTLGLFTAIQRLKAVHARIADRLARAGLPLYAQHVDPIDTGTLVDIFRDDPRASLLGTDALRDGVDVPGHSLRLVVMEGVPWPRPTVLHAARRAAGGGTAYDDRVVRARLAQAFGRLIRAREEKACSSCSPRRPSAPARAPFRPGSRMRRLPLDEAVARVRERLSTPALSGISSAGERGRKGRMKSLTLLRHAKSGWDDPVARDFDRPLNPRGRRAARTVGARCGREGLAFDLVLASPAGRAIETLEEVAERLWTARARI